MKAILYNSSNLKYKTPLGANSINEEISINLFIIKHYHMDNVSLVINDDFSNHYMQVVLQQSQDNDDYNIYTTKLNITKSGHYWYYFIVHDVYGKHYICPNDALDASLTNELKSAWYLGIHDSFRNSNWPLGKIIYQIFPDRFYKEQFIYQKPDVIIRKNWDEEPLKGDAIGKDFFGGNIPGITKKLDYLKSLGVAIIYLNPIFEASSNHKYDTGDYLTIDPMFGSEEDLKILIDEAKRRGIFIIFDAVFNHTGSDSIYFNKESRYDGIGAYQDKSSIYYSWYKFIDYPNDYHSWWGFKTLPSVNQKEKTYIDFICGDKGVLNKWLNFGLRGIRLDVVDELENEFLEEVCYRTKKEDAENFIIGEVWEDAAIKCAYNKRRNYFNGRQLDSVMNYPLKDAIIHFIKTGHSQSVAYTMRRLVAHYPKYILDRLMNILGTHDTKRILTVLKFKDDNNKLAFKYLRLASLMQYTLPGIPCLYYGDEIGLEGDKDPASRGTFRWERLDNEINKWYKTLARIRQNEIFREGGYLEVYVKKEIFVYLRYQEKRKVTIIINRSTSNFYYKINKGIDLITNQDIQDKICVLSLDCALIEEEN